MSFKGELDAAKKFREKYDSSAKKVYDIYLREEEAGRYELGDQVNFFFSNVNTIKESLFNSLPKPDVSRLHKEDYNNDVARVASIIVSRALNYEINCNRDFATALRAAIFDRLVPGVGTVWVRLEGETSEVDGSVSVVEGTERIRIDQVLWSDFIWQPAKNWEEVEWCGRWVCFSKEEVEEKFGKDALTKLELTEEGNVKKPSEGVDYNKIRLLEVWDRRTKKVIHYSGDGAQEIKSVEDPLRLKNFFPCPPPMLANPYSSKLLPVPDYVVAQDQYYQLDVLYARITLITKAIKVAGAYDATATSIKNMLTSSENTLIPVDDWAMYAERGGSKGLIDWYPVQEVVRVLEVLQGQFEASKAILFEITGMSDIVRGASNQYETAKAQQIKAQFASVRLGGYQRDVSMFVSELLRIMAEIMVQLYSDQKLQNIVGRLPEPDMPFAQEALATLRDDDLSGYNISIKADSLTQADWGLEKDQRMEVANTLGTFIGSIAQMASETPEVVPLAVQVVKFVVSGFKGAYEIEGWLDQQLDQLNQKAANPPKKEPSPEEQKSQAEMQKMQAEMQMMQQENDMKLQQMQADFQLQQQKAQLELQEMQANLMFLQQKHQIELQTALEKQAVSRQAMNDKLEAQKASAELKEEHKESSSES